VRSREGEVDRTRLIAAVTTSTALIGMASYYTTVFLFQLIPRNMMFEIGMLILGTISGLAGGYLAALVWQKSVRHLVT